MIRFNKAIAAAALLFVMPSLASALGIEIVNVSGTASTTSLQNGDEITFDLRLSNPGRVDVFGLDVVVSGFDTPNTTDFISSGLQLVGGSVARNAFGTAFEPNPDDSDGLFNQLPVPQQVWAPNAQFPQPVRTWLFGGVDTVGHDGDGNQDNGALGGQTGPSGDIHFRVTYRLVVNNSGPTQNLLLSFGTLEQFGHVAVGAGGNLLPFQNATYALSVIPEPGTALLMGLGLAGLAARRR